MINPRLLRRRPDDWPLARWVRWRYAWWLPTRWEIRTAYLDVRAGLLGYCNDCPVDQFRSRGGYAFWRCALRRDHTEPHRYNNYVWTTAGRVEYQPVPVGQRTPTQDRERGVGAAYPLRIRRDAREVRRRLGPRPTA